MHGCLRIKSHSKTFFHVANSNEYGVYGIECGCYWFVACVFVASQQHIMHTQKKAKMSSKIVIIRVFRSRSPRISANLRDAQVISVEAWNERHDACNNIRSNFRYKSVILNYGFEKLVDMEIGIGNMHCTVLVYNL